MRDIQGGAGEHLVGRLFVKRPLRCYLNDPLGPTPPSSEYEGRERNGGDRRAPARGMQTRNARRMRPGRRPPGIISGFVREIP